MPKFICPVPKYFGFRCISAETDAEIPNPKLMPKSETNAKIPNICRNPKHMPKSQTYAEIPNICRNSNIWKYMPKSLMLDLEMDGILSAALGNCGFSISHMTY